MKRRIMLGSAGLLAFPLSLIASAPNATPSQTEGPFYPVTGIPMRTALIREGSALVEQAIVLRGRVLDIAGQPRPNAKIEIWQCDDNGVYEHPSQPGRERFNQEFLGFGAQLTNAAGEYSFSTLYPVPYTGRPPHIHVKLWDADRELLTTQLYLKGDTGGSWFSAKRDPLQIEPSLQADGARVATFDFVA